jgi:hypothetical protein
MSPKAGNAWWLGAITIATLLSLLACNDSSRKAPMTLPPDLAKATTVCIGRYLVDIPNAFAPTSATYAQFYYGLDNNFRTVDFSILSSSGDQAVLDAIVEKRVGELTSTYHFSSASKNMLAANRRIENGNRLLRVYEDSRSTATFKSELYSRQGPATVLFSRTVYSHESGDAVDASLIKMAGASSYVPQGALAGRGACLGAVKVDAAQDAEILHPSFESAQYPDIVISIDMNSIVAKSDGGLFARVDAKADLVSKFVFHSDTLRKDKMTIAGRAAEEILEAGKDHDKIVRSFTAETLLLAPSTFAQPLISIDMTMGGQVKDTYRDASLSEAQSLALWDSIVKSIRIRPGSL